jgi:hypothetical protein
MSKLTISLGQKTTGQGISLDAGGDVDTEFVSVGNPATGARETGNGQALKAADGNTIPDHYMQFIIDDAVLFKGKPTSSVRLDIEYFDQGTDTFTVQYDAASGGPNGNGTFVETDPIIKTNSMQFKTASFVLNDIYFGNRDNAADFRISDRGDGAEIISRVTITLLPVP